MLWDYPDYIDFVKDVMKLPPDLQKVEFQEWQKDTATFSPKLFPGFLDMLKEYRKRGGIICVCSHSQAHDIERHYMEFGFIPDEIFGYVIGHPEMCKPFTYPIDTIKAKYNLQSSDIAVIDDLYPGLKMAIDSGADPIGVMYGQGHELVKDDLVKICKRTFTTVSQLSDFLLCAQEAQKEE